MLRTSKTDRVTDIISDGLVSGTWVCVGLIGISAGTPGWMCFGAFAIFVGLLSALQFILAFF